jgi:hypothetical protein
MPLKKDLPPIVAARKALPKRRTRYILNSLLQAHWPYWDIQSHAEGISESIQNKRDKRGKCGEYLSDYRAFPIYVAKNAHRGQVDWKTRAFVPAVYRPILRLLNCRINWHVMSLEIQPSLKLVGLSSNAKNQTDAQKTYAEYVDGHTRNLIYHHSVRKEFFRWLDDTYYKGIKATGRIPTMKPMVPQRCELLETWMFIELFIHAHDEKSIAAFKNNPTSKPQRKIKDIFRTGIISFQTYFSDVDSYFRRLGCPRSQSTALR